MAVEMEAVVEVMVVEVEVVVLEMEAVVEGMMAVAVVARRGPW